MNMEENGLSGNDNMTTLQRVTEYYPTMAEEKLLEVLLSPEHRMKSITDICKVAGCSRVLYYSAFKKPEFQALYKSQSKALVDQSIAPVLNTFVREALRGSFQHGKVILEMAGLYSEKSQLEVTGEINVNMSQSEIRARIASLLSGKQLDSAIPADYTIIQDKPVEPED
jgi:hypothetical protein